MRCCICGTIKNCEIYFDKVIQNIEKISSLFTDYKIILYYDKSDDNTLMKIKEYSKINERFRYFVNRSPLFQYRTHNIAKGRNKCLEFIRNECNDYEMFIMMDMDDINCKDLNLEILEKYLYRDDWDALSFNRKDIYYDVWALSIYPYYISLFAFEKRDEISKLMLDHINILLKNLEPDELLPCVSAFCGFSIYRTEKFINCKYDGRLRLDLLPLKKILEKNNPINSKLNLKNEDCEHRAFHLEAISKNHARIRISSEILFY